MTPGRRHTDPADLPSELTAYAMRDLNALHRKASAHGEHVGACAVAVLEHPLPWTKMRQVYRLLGLVRRHRTVHTERADKRFKRLRGARLDGSYEDEMRKLHRIDLLIIDDLALHRLEATETGDFDELIVERRRNASTGITSNREPPRS